MNKLKAITRSVSFNPSTSTSNKNNRHEKDKMEAVVGFKLTLHESLNDAACGTIFFFEFSPIVFFFHETFVNFYKRA